MLGLFVFLYFIITNRTCNNLILDFIEAVLSPFLNFFGVTGFVFFVLFVQSFFVSLLSSLCFFSTNITRLVIFLKFLNLLHCLTLTAISPSFHYSIYTGVISLSVYYAQCLNIQNKSQCI